MKGRSKGEKVRESQNKEYFEYMGEYGGRKEGGEDRSERWRGREKSIRNLKREEGRDVRAWREGIYEV